MALDKKKEDILIELEATDSPQLQHNVNKKLIFNFDMQLLKKDYTDDIDDDSILENIVVAIIWKYDFSKTVHLDNLLILDAFTNTLPFSLIKYQIPCLIKTKVPRSKTVGICIHYTYSIPPNLKFWVDSHLSFGINEIMMYDSVNNELTKLLRSLYGDDNRITVHPFNIGFNDLCNETFLLKQYKDMNITDQIKKYLVQSCKVIYETEFNGGHSIRHHFEQLTSNDCFTVMKENHEFIAFYDLDEFIFPRTIENAFNSTTNYYSCNSYDSICSIKPFEFNLNPKEIATNYFYNYLQSLINKNRNGRDVKKLGSIGFGHAIYLIPNHFEKQLIYDLGSIIEKIESNNNSSAFPYNISFQITASKTGRTFLIQKEDVDYTKYLYKSYKSLIPCTLNNYLKNISLVEEDFVRYLYYITEGNERMGKAIHYYKNIRSLWVHRAKDVVKDHWSFTAPQSEGHFLPHFRKGIDGFLKNDVKGSIRKLRIDFEYLILLLKNYTPFCNIE